MMNLADRIHSFARIGNYLNSYPGEPSDDEMALIRNAALLACQENGWFTAGNVTMALRGLGTMINGSKLEQWVLPYIESIEKQTTQKTIGVVMAGNIPMVGFHDFLCVLISGNKIICKLSSDDSRLLPVMAELLIKNDNRWKDQIFFSKGRLENFDGIIATGNNTSARHFDYYFRKYPHLIRHNRNSIAIIDGNETKETLEKMASDIMLYFGMGCRSVSRIYIPENYNFTPLIQALERYSGFIHHHKYYNNYQYNRTVFALNQIPVIDPGFILLVENPALSSRIAVLHYTFYHNIRDVIADISTHSEEIQCVVSNNSCGIPTIKPGEAQFPALTDYSDNMDTLNFLINI